MSQPLLAKSLHPVLQAALSSLDVQLEVELAQYRCHQTVRRLSPLVLRSQNSIQKTSHEMLGAKATTTTELSEDSHLNLVSNSEASILISSSPEGASLPEVTHPLTLEAYLEFVNAYWQNLETKTSTKSRFLQSVCKPLAVAAISLLLSMSLSYVMLNYLISLNRISSNTCLAGVKLLQRCSNFR